MGSEVCRIDKNRNRIGRHQFVHHRKALCYQPDIDHGHAGEIAAGPREACGEPRLYRVGTNQIDDGYGLGGRFGGLRSRSAAVDDDGGYLAAAGNRP